MKIKLHLILVLMCVCAAGLVYGQKSKPYSEEDAKAYDGRIQQVKGRVVFIDKNGEKTPASGQYLVFQRVDCKDCLVATYSDGNGNYKILLGVGRYKLIVQFKNCGVVAVEDCAGYNYLSDDQPQYLVVERGTYGPEFNIELVLPKN
jgi:hypothetical protein